MEGVSKERANKKKYNLMRKIDGIYLKIEIDDAINFPITSEQLLKDLTKRRIPFETPLVEKIFELARGDEVKIAPYIEGINSNVFLKICLTPDRLKAYLQLYPAIDGSRLKVKDIENALQDNGVRVGIQRHLFPAIIERQESFTEWLIAEGIVGIDGSDARLIYHFNPNGLNIKPQELADGTVDFYNLNLIQIVESGKVLVEKVEATKGTKGVSVLGEETMAKDGKDVRLPLGQNTQIVENNMKLISTKEGHVALLNGKVCVLANYEVHGDVDFTTGNIKFPGNVIVRGNVKNNFEVTASGDVEIHGNLEGLVNVDGNLQVKNGIVRGKTVVHGSIFARYIEDSTAESSVNIIVSEAIMHSQVKAGKEIQVGGKKGVIVGGYLCAGEEIAAKTIGSVMGTVTNLEVGIKPELRQEYKDVCRQVVVQKENLQKTQTLFKTLQEIKQKTGSLPPDKSELLLKVSRGLYQMQQEVEELGRRKIELEILFEEMNKAKVVAENSIFSGVTICMNKANYVVAEELKRVVAIMDGFDIRISPLVGKGGKDV